jgi:hypothetical protein
MNLKKKEQNKQSKTIYILVNIKVWCFQISKNYTAKDQAKIPLAIIKVWCFKKKPRKTAKN